MWHVERDAYGVLVRNLTERDIWLELGADGTTVLKRMLKIGWNGMDKTDVAHDKDRWRAVVNTVMKIQVP